jgi:hypothetical protein
MEYLEHRIAREEAERERKYQEDIGAIGRMFDNHWTFCAIMAVLPPLGFLIGLGIGNLL